MTTDKKTIFFFSAVSALALQAVAAAGPAYGAEDKTFEGLPGIYSPAAGFSALFWGLLLVPLGIISLYLTLKFMKKVQQARVKELSVELKEDALRYEKAGEFVSAGLVYEKMKDFDRAAFFYEKGGDVERAAGVYERSSNWKKAREMHEKAGDFMKAAAICENHGDYIEAARIYAARGDKSAAARALEKTGNRLAAVRAYREAGEYLVASKLLKEEGMIKEAADMYSFAIKGMELNAANLNSFYEYADLLEKAGAREAACEEFGRIISFDPNYRDSKERMENLLPSKPPAEFAARPEPRRPLPGRAPEQGKTLSDVIKSRRSSPKDALKLWVSLLKAVAAKQREAGAMISICPELVAIGGDSPVALMEGTCRESLYTPPHALLAEGRGHIYSLGAILFAMLTGGPEKIEEDPEAKMKDQPQWLQNLVLNCIEKDRATRYRSIEDIFAAIRELKGRI